MELVQPGLGLIFWMTLSFGILLWILGKFAWKPIMKGLKDREQTIENALNEANLAREEMKQLQFSNEQLLKEAKEERDHLLREARKVKESIMEEARERANAEAGRIIENARESIQYEKLAAIHDVKNQLAKLTIEIAEKLMQKELSDKKEQTKLIEKLLDEVKLN
ncbi:MAG: F0F1 ATP synthase subunit B [Bacteroidales bacterium]